MVCFLFGASEPNNITIVKVRKNVGLEKNKQKGYVEAEPKRADEASSDYGRSSYTPC